jgi:glutamate-1-semialdehyde aminotransferase
MEGTMEEHREAMREMMETADRRPGAYSALNEYVAMLHDELTSLTDTLSMALKPEGPEAALAKVVGETDLERLVERVDDAVSRVRSLRQRLAL